MSLLRMESGAMPIFQHLTHIHKLDANHKGRFCGGHWSIPHHRVKANQDQSAVLYNPIAPDPEAARDHMCIGGNLVSSKGFLYRYRHSITLITKEEDGRSVALLASSTQLSKKSG